jgi:AGCS family alanine or glycine:cation symporter
MALGYLLVGLYILGVNYSNILPAFKLIISSAFSGQAAVGGFVGSSCIFALQSGAQFGIFANEAGLGSFAIAGASAKNQYPAEQGMLAITGVFIATMVVCTITGLVLAVTDVLGTVTAIDAKLLMGSPLALAAFGSVHFSFRYIVLIGLVLFAFTTVLAWAYYGEKCIEFILGTKAARIYRWLYISIIVAGSVLELELVWNFANLANGLMAIPNLYSLILLAPVVKKETVNYLQRHN